MAKYKDRKDANLVIGAVLLITVMVVISVAVDSWIGKASPSSQVEKVNISSFSFSGGRKIIIILENNGTVPFEITEVWINNEKQAFTANSTMIQPKERVELLIAYMYSNGINYYFKVLSTRGTTYLFTASAL